MAMDSSGLLTNLSGLQPNRTGESLIFGECHLSGLGITNPIVHLKPYLRITELNLANNQVQSTRFLEQLPDLIKLDLSNNNLIEFDGILWCTKLEIFDGTHNEITRIPKLVSLPFLQRLELKDNRIDSICGLWGCRSLHTLNLVNNALTAATLLGLDLDYLQFGSLELIDQLNNAFCDTEEQRQLIRHIHPPLLGLPRLRVLKLSGNASLFTVINVTLDANHWIALSYPNANEFRDRNEHFIQRGDSTAYIARQGLFPLTLSELQLSGCGITQLAGLINLPSLHSLDLSDNHIVDLAVLNVLQSSPMLRHLNLCRNPITEQNNYRSRLISHFDHLISLDGEHVTLKEKVSTREYYKPTLRQLASHDHRVNTLYHFTKPQILRDCTLQTLSTPYPILALIGPAGSNKHRLARKLVEKAGDFFAYLKCHTDAPYFWNMIRSQDPTSEGSSSSGNEGSSFSENSSGVNSVQEERIKQAYRDRRTEPTLSGFDYEHISSDEFDRKRASGDFIQTAQVGGYQYGLSWSTLEAIARQGLAGVFVGELESMLSLKLSGLQPRFILCLPDDSVQHEARLREHYPLAAFLLDLGSPSVPCPVESAAERQQTYIQWCLDRASKHYLQAYRENPGWFDAVLCTNQVESSFDQLLLIVLDYLGLNPENLALNKETSARAANPTPKQSRLDQTMLNRISPVRNRIRETYWSA